MKKIAITTDSNSGILPEEVAEQGVFILPMPFLVNDEPHFENIDLTQEQFYELLAKNANVSTSQPSIGDLTAFWEELLKEYDEIVHLPMSSGLSQSCATAKILAKDFDGKVFVVDNHRISVTLKESVFDAVKLREKGLDGKAILEYLEKRGAESSIYIAVDTMKYLKKGGRVTPAAAAIGTILRLKPVLQIQGERLDKFAIARGLLKAKETMKNAVKNDLENRFKDFVDNGEMTVSVAHTNAPNEAEAFVAELKALFPTIPFRFCDPLSLSVSCHIGPGALAVAISRIIK